LKDAGVEAAVKEHLAEVVAHREATFGY
jgi:hypothetical protein